MIVHKFIIIMFFVLVLRCYGQVDEINKMDNKNISSQDSNVELMKKMIGKWKGNCKTWFEPDKLADESNVSSEITGIFGGKFLRHTYRGTIKGKKREGEEIICFNSMSGLFETSWIDDFHMNYAIMFSQGKPKERGFSVSGGYDVGNNLPRWGWRTEYVLTDDDHLMITAYNITPEGLEAKAIETKYYRIK